jgi:hypothetical protein
LQILIQKKRQIPAKQLVDIVVKSPFSGKQAKLMYICRVLFEILLVGKPLETLGAGELLLSLVDPFHVVLELAGDPEALGAEAAHHLKHVRYFKYAAAFRARQLNKMHGVFQLIYIYASHAGPELFQEYKENILQ